MQTAPESARATAGRAAMEAAVHLEIQAYLGIVTTRAIGEAIESAVQQDPRVKAAADMLATLQEIAGDEPRAILSGTTAEGLRETARRCIARATGATS